MERDESSPDDATEQPVISAGLPGPTVEMPLAMFVDVMTALLDPTPEALTRAWHWFGVAGELLKAAKEQDDRGDV